MITTSTRVDTITGTKPKTDMVIGHRETTTEMRGMRSTFDVEIVIVKREIQGLRRYLANY